MSGALEIEVPGDKSVTHRALLFGSLATGVMRVRNPLVSADTQATASVLRQLGVAIPELGGAEVEFTGVGLRGLEAPLEPLDCGNSGTTARLLLGILAGQPLEATVTGDASLRSRPMARVTDLLALMKARFTWGELPGRLPVTVSGGSLSPIDIETGVASAQVKSAVLLAGLTGGVFALVTEPRRSRDHTETMLAAMGASTVCHDAQGGWRVELRDPPASISALDIDVPADFSTAAFPLVWAVCRTDGPPLRIPSVGLNPTRTGLLDVLRRMGARIDVIDEDPGGPEPTGTLVAHPSRLEGTDVYGSEIPSLIDEIPALVVAALHAEGPTSVTGAGELRVKESDRINALVQNLRAIGATVDEAEDGISVAGQGSSLTGSAQNFDDHRIEMAFGVLEALTGGEVRVVARTTADVSYPSFWSEMQRLQSASRRDRAPERSTRRPVVTIDGPAGSGKSTTARAVARKLGLVHLDSGALYRAVAHVLLESDLAEDRWADQPPSYFAGLGLSAAVKGRGIELFLHGKPIPDEQLRTPEVTAAVSRVAALPSVREALIGLQRQAASQGGLVADGRDLGTVVFPDADAKIFLIADLEVRARRRLHETQGDATEATEEVEVAVMAQRLQSRDFEDAHRKHAPLRRPEGAIVIDTTDLTPEDQLERVLERVRELWMG